MDPVKILKRAWHILWNYRALWVFGLILALTAAGSAGGNGNSGSNYQFDDSQSQFDMPLPEDWRGAIGEAFSEAGQAFDRFLEEGLPALGISQEELTAILWILVAFVLVMLVIGLVMAVYRYVAETALIRMVDEYEAADSKMTVRQGFQIGWSRTSWRLFLINLIVHLPVILLLSLLAVAGFIIYTLVESNIQPFAVTGIVSLIGILFLVIFVVVILSILLRLLRQFFWRVCALEEVGVGEALRRGYVLVRENWKSVGLMWLIMIGLGIAWMVVSFVAVIITIPVVIVTSIIAAIVAAIPGLLLAGFFSLFLSGYLPWIAGLLFVLPLFAVLAFSPWTLLTAWQMVFTSSVWTLTYREIKALPSLTADIQVGPVGD